ncbi:MAG: heme ABC transporter ATP-binding protein [Sphingobacteriales bacterium]
MLKTENIYYRVGNKKILQGITTSFESELFHVIVGPNGCGKSTFLKVFSGELKPQEGTVSYDGENVFHISKSSLAKRRAVMSQHQELQFPLIVAEVVIMGRYPHFDFRPDKIDEDICAEAMKIADISHLADRDYLTLSGGEKQRVHFARVLAQIWNNGSSNKFLFLDEAVSHLDLKHQHQLLQTTKELCNKNVTIIAVLHDLNLAYTYGNHILFMKEGKVYHETDDMLQINPSVIRDVFEVNVNIFTPVNSNRPVIVF